MTQFANQVFLPVCLAFMMWVVGTGLRVSSFRPLLETPKPVFIGLISQLVLLPLIVWGLIGLLDLPAWVAAGLIILACAPGGATSNLFSHLAQADVPLSIVLTACISLLAPVWMPWVVPLQLSWLGYEVVFRLSYAQTVAQLAVATIVPLLLGMLSRCYFESWVRANAALLQRAATLVLLTMIATLVAVNWPRLQLAEMGLAAAMVLLLAVLAMPAGYLFARVLRMSERQARTLSFETGIQNAAVAMMVAFMQLQMVELGMLALLYGILMNIPAFITLWLFRRKAIRY